MSHPRFKWLPCHGSLSSLNRQFTSHAHTLSPPLSFLSLFPLPFASDLQRRASLTPAAIQEHGVTRVTITKHGDRKLGLLFDVADPKTGTGVVVKNVKPDGLAAETRAFAPGQRVVSLNNKDTARMTKKELIEIIKATGSKVEFGLRMPQRPAAIAGSPRTPAQHVHQRGTAGSNGPTQGNTGKP